MKTIRNAMWFVVCGLRMAFRWLAPALILAMTITGIPIQRQWGRVRAWVGIVLGGLGCGLLALIVIAVIAGQLADTDASS